MKHRATLLVLGALGASPSIALAFQAPRHVSSGGLEVASGVAPIRGAPGIVYDRVPAARRKAWVRFLAATGSDRWRASWDEATGVPSRIYGEGIAAPGAVAAGAAAEAHARAFLAAHGDLVAPGIAADDLVVAADDLWNGMRIVSFAQRAGSIPVTLASVSFRYKHDRLILIASSAVPGAHAEPATVARADAEATMRAWVAEQHGQTGLVAPADLVLLPLLRAASYEVRTAWHGVVEAHAPAGRYDVYIDASAGRRIAREQLLRFAQGTVLFDAPVRAPQDARATYPTPLADITIDGGAAETDTVGAFSWPGPSAASLSLLPHGSQIAIQTLSGTLASASFNVDDGGQAVWSLASDELGDAQLSAFIHTGIAKNRARLVAPGSPFPDQQQPVRVNRNEEDYLCNAYWDGTATNFFIEYGGCNNTARLADVVYHEYGHGVHQHAIVPSAGAFDSSLSEGASDYLAATITGDPEMAPGFYIEGGSLRELDTDRRWPDDIDGDPHVTGLIFAGAMWDLRQGLVADLGEAEGVPIADGLWYQALRGATDIPSTYSEILAADDDDGDLSNGTPHICAINRAFVAHNLTGFVNSAGLTVKHEALSVVPPDVPTPVRVTTSALYPQCVGDPVETIAAAVTSRPAGVATTVELTAHGDEYVGELPARAQGTGYAYQLEIVAGGNTFRLPNNAADPEYRFFVGETRPLYCTDFESDAAGWTPGAMSGSGDFEWGEPQGKAGDPEAAFSGKKVIGNDLGSGTDDGKYQKKKVAFMDGPTIDLQGEKHLRLQYRRWLSVEDGYFDQASVYVNGQRLWQNDGTDETNGALDLKDAEWRFEDIDVSPIAAAGATTAEVRFEIASDIANQLGGWNVDDLCLVAWTPPPPTQPPVTGEGGNATAEADPALDPGGGCACEAARSSREAPPFAALAVLGGVCAVRRRRRR